MHNELWLAESERLGMYSLTNVHEVLFLYSDSRETIVG